MRKMLVFLSSYIPLYLLLIGKDIFERINRVDNFNIFEVELTEIKFFNHLNDFMICILLVMSVVLFVWLKIYIRPAQDCNSFRIVDYSNNTDKYFLNYITIYFLPCIGLSIESSVDIFILVSIMFIVGSIYVSNDLVYINPTMGFMGYRVYRVRLKGNFDGDGETEKYVIAHKKLEDRIVLGNVIKVASEKEYCLLQE